MIEARKSRRCVRPVLVESQPEQRRTRRREAAIMTLLRRSIWALLALGALTVAACSEQTVEPNGTQIAGDPVSAKKGGGGKPGSGTPADPAITYYQNTNCTSLWVINADGSNRTEIGDCNSSPGPAWTPAWSPDGKSIAFYDLGLGDLYVVDVALTAGGNPIAQNRRLLVATGLAHIPAWSPLGDVIAYSVDDSLYTVPAIGGSPTVVCLGCGAHPTWSPDGTKLAFYSNTFESPAAALKTITVSTGDIQTLIPQGAFDYIWYPDWSRSGDRIAFDGTPLGNGPRGTYVLDLVTGDYSLLTDLGWPASWSPDDQELVVRNRGLPGSGGLVVNSTSGAVMRKIGKRTMSSPDWRRCTPGPGCGPGN
jgi:Tol biopolymer transport system component